MRRPDRTRLRSSVKRGRQFKTRQHRFESLEGRALLATITGSTGPGGFEATIGASSLALWFDAGSLGGQADGTPIASWTNNSAATGAGAAATQANAANQPTLQTDPIDLINNQPVLRFDGTDDFLQGAVTAGLEKTFYLVSTASGSPAGCCSGGIYTHNSGDGGTSNGLEHINSGGPRLFMDFPGSGTAGPTSILNNPNVGSLVYSTAGTSLYLNGATEASNAFDWTKTGNEFQIGTRNNELGRFLRGDVAEAVIFNRVLNTAERQIVDSALGAKYGMTSVTGDRYSGDTLANGDYDLGVFGIGRTGVGSEVLSAGHAGFGLEATALADGTFVMAGHRQSSNSLVTTDLPGGVVSRWSRSWFVEKTGPTTSTTLAFDFTDAGLSTPAPSTTYKLLYRANTASPFVALAATATVAGDTITFSLPDANLANGYYTLGTDIVPAVVPAVTGGTGPGGVGTVNTVSSPDLALWLKADTLAGADGSNLTTWTNSVTSAGAASAATVANTAPSLENAAGDLKNGNPVVNFSGPVAASTGDVISGTGNFTANKSLFLLAQQRTITGDTCCQGGVSIGVDSNGLVPSGNAWATDWNGAPGNAGSPNKLGSWSVVSGLYDNGTTFTGTRLWVDGNGSYTNSGSSQGTTSTTYRLGSRANDGDGRSRFFDGNIGEAIAYNSVLNNAQRVLIENYLSAKWDVPLAANDYYTGDNAGLGNYDLDLFGIGSFDSTNRVENTGAAGFGLAATNGFAPGTQFVLAGHKVASNALVGTNLPAAIGQRWNRAWYVDKSGSIDATLSFDFSDAGLGAIPTGTSGYKLLYSPNNSFEASSSAFTVVSAAPTVSGDKITFTLSNANLNDGYYTLGLEVSSDVVLQATAPQAGDGVADAWRIVRNGGNTEFYNGATLVRSQATAGITSITVQGSADNDTLTVDYSGGDPAPNIAIAYNGNGQSSVPGDTLVVNGGSATNVVYRFINDHDGSVSVDGKLINYTGLEPVTTNITATNVDLFYSDNAETITVTAAGAGQTMVDSTQGESVTFINPTGRLQIHAGNVASDTIQVNGIGSGFSASLLLNGGGGSDTVTFGGAATLSFGGNLTVSAETVTQTQPITVVGTTTFQAADYAAEVERDTPALYYRLNETTGTIAAPTIGSVNGAYQNGPVLGTVGPLTGNASNLAPNFDGTNDWVQLQNAGGLLPASLFSDGAYSIEIWFSSNAGANSKDIVSLTDVTGNGHGVLLESAGTRQLRYLHRSPSGGSGGQQINPSNQQYVNGTWNHLVAVHTGTQLRLYLNGVQDSVTAASTTPINYAINAALGRISVVTADRFWAGGLDEFAIYDAALTPTQIQAHYAAAGGVTNVTLDNAANNFGGAVSVGGGGAVSLRDANALVLGNIAVATSLTVESPTTITQTGLISGTGALTKLGDGTLTLSQANTYSGVTNVNRGSIVVAHNNAFGSTAAGTTVADNHAWVRLNNGITVTGETITINGSGDNGAGESFSGALQAAAGATGTWAGTVALGTTARVGALAGGTLVLSGDISGSNPIFISGASGTGKVLVSGTTKSYTGATNIVRGILQLGAANVLPAATILDIDTANATEDSLFDLNGFHQTIGTLRRTDTPTGGGASTITNSSATPATLTVNQSVNTSYSGNITGALALTKSGTGTLALAGATGNTYTGLTTVSGGTLDLNKTAGNAVSGDLTITSGAKITFKRSNQIVDTATVTMSGNGSVFNGTGINAGQLTSIVETIGSLLVTGGTFNPGATSNWTITGAASFTGGAGNTIVVGNSGATMRFGSLALVNMTATAGGTVETNNSFTLYGNSGTVLSSITVGSGGLNLNGSVLNLRRGGAGTLGSKLVLNGDVTTSGSVASAIIEDTAGGTAGTLALELSGTAASVDRTLNVGPNLEIRVPITNGAASSGGIVKTGAGTLLLSRANTYSGATNVVAGTLQLANASALGDIAAGTTVQSGAVLNLNGQAITGEALTLSGTGAGAGALTNSVATAASWSGLVNNGAYSVGGLGNITLSGQVSTSNSTLTKVSNNLLTLSGTADNGGLVAIVNAGVLELAKTSSGGVHAIGGADTSLTINNGGTVRLAGTGGDQIYFQADLLVNAGGLFDLNGRSEGIDGLNGDGTITNSSATPVTLTVGESNSGGTFGGGITGPLALTKVGAGTLLLNGASTYTGPTQVNAGTLGGGGSLTSDITVANLATLSPGGTPGTLTTTGNTTLQSGSIYRVELIGTSNDQLATNGVDLTDAVLDASSDSNLGAGTPFIIINNTSANAVLGTFAGLPENASFFINGYQYFITYVYNGNDVAIIRNQMVDAIDDQFGPILVNTSLTANTYTNDSDPDGDARSTVIAQPLNGKVFMDPATGQFTYTPKPNFIGTDSFTYRLSDGEFNDTAIVEIIVAPLLVDGSGVLQVGGTTGGDNIIVQAGSIRYNNTTYPLSASRVVVHGGGGNDTISVTASNIAVEFYGDDGDDYLSGGSLNDILDGGAGTDRLLGNAGDDRMYGGGGSDNLSGGVGNDYLSGDGYLDASSLEQQAADAGKDTLSGDAGDDEIHGGAGMDTLLGGIGNDYLSGGEDGDAIDGGAGHDILLGDGGGDKLYGRAGNDVLIGGAGLDTLLGDTGLDLVYGGDVTASLSEATLRAIALQWFTPATQTAAVNQLLGYKQDDLVSDTLNGEADDDWYLIFAKDLIAATERFPGNRKTQL